MTHRDKNRLQTILNTKRSSTPTIFNSLRGKGVEVGDIVGPAWDGGPWDAELGIAYRGENGPVYYTGKGIETTDDIE